MHFQLPFCAQSLTLDTTSPRGTGHLSEMTKKGVGSLQVSWNSTNCSPDVSEAASLPLCVPRCIPSRVRAPLSSPWWGASHQEMQTGQVSFYKQGFAPAQLRHASNEGNSGKDTSQESLCVSAEPFSVSTDRHFVVIQKKSSRSWRRKAAIFSLTCLNITSAAHLKHSSTSVPASVSVLQNL